MFICLGHDYRSVLQNEQVCLEHFEIWICTFTKDKNAAVTW